MRRTNGVRRRGARRRWCSGLLVTALVSGTVLAGAEGTAVAGGRGRWVEQSRLAQARGLHGVATVNGRIFVFGGFDPGAGRILDSVEARSTRLGGSWRGSTPESEARANAAAVEVGGLVYLVGGEDALNPDLDAVEVFNPRTGTWAHGVSMPGRRSAPGAAAVNGLVYVAGGFVGDGATASVVVFDPARRTWKFVAPMSTARGRLRMVAANGLLYAIGGQDPQGVSLSTVERYDPGSDTWITVAPLREQRTQPGAVVLGQGRQAVIAVVGGARSVDFESVAFHRTTEVYDVRTGRWRTIEARLPLGKAGLACAVQSDGAILAIGGGIMRGGRTFATDEVYALDLDDHHG